MDPRIEVIREHPLVGEGSCSVIEECWTNQEILDELNNEGIRSPEGAIKWAIMMQGLFLEQGLNCRFGSDDDEQLIAWNEFQKEKEKYEDLELTKKGL